MVGLPDLYESTQTEGIIQVSGSSGTEVVSRGQVWGGDSRSGTTWVVGRGRGGRTLRGFLEGKLSRSEIVKVRFVYWKEEI